MLAIMRITQALLICKAELIFLLSIIYHKLLNQLSQRSSISKAELLQIKALFLATIQLS